MREDNNKTPPVSLLASLFLVSSALIAHEIVLTRLFSIAQWHHFAYMVISVALLGFGASGTFMSLCRAFVLARFQKVYAAAAWLYAAAIILSFLMTREIPFDPFLIVWDPRQSLYLLGYCATLFVPFLLAAVCIGATFVRYARHVNRIYFANMAGSGFGGVGVLLTMYDTRTNLSRQVVDEVISYFKNRVYKTIIPRNIKLAEAPSYGMPINIYDPKSLGAISYYNLSKEFIINGEKSIR